MADYNDLDPGAIEFLNLNGDLRIKDRGVDIAADVILSSRGSFKYAPLVAGEARAFLNSPSSPVVIQRSFKVALKAAGFERPSVNISNYPEVITVNNEEILISENGD